MVKTRESGMPPETMWQEFFSPQSILSTLGLTPDCQLVVDMGCGYGTFSIPAAEIAAGRVLALDIDPEMVANTSAKGAHLPNLSVACRDFVDRGTGLEDAVADYAMLFNILHAAEANLLLREAKRILRPGGTLGVMHWNYDATTPRGPSMAVRLTPEQCQKLVEKAGFKVGSLTPLPPHHYGFQAIVA